MRLLTPGPLAIPLEVKDAMRHDLGSRDIAFREVTRKIRAGLAEIAGCGDDHAVVPIQGSGTFAIEAALATFVGRRHHVLVCTNGMYGQLAEKILTVRGVAHTVLRSSFDAAIDTGRVDAVLRNGHAFTHLYFVHCETTAGVVNPYRDLLDLARGRGIATIVDSMSAFGALDVDAARDGFDVLVSSSNKCLEAPPGIAFAIVRKSLFAGSRLAAGTYTLDLWDQWRQFEETGDWRSTPPTHVAQALLAAVQLLHKEGVAARRQRYTNLCTRLITGMSRFDIRPVLHPSIQSPVTVAFSSAKLCSDEPSFRRFYLFLRDAGLLIYARFQRELSAVRVGCMGDVPVSWIDEFVDRVGQFVSTKRERRPVAAYTRRELTA